MNRQVIWSEPPEDLKIDPGKVHIWLVNLDRDFQESGVLPDILSEDERARASRYKFLKDRNQFIYTRTALRILLGCYLSRNPKEICFNYGTNGKPEISDSTFLQFNISHSHGLALFAFVLDNMIGIDLEKINPRIEIALLARQFFSINETKNILSLNPADQYRAFFHCWTCKEAFIKAKGGGLSIPLDQFEVSTHPNEPAELLATDWNPSESALWHLQTLELGHEFVGALAVQGIVEKIHCWNWKPGRMFL